ncbi:MAG: hypothetical protein P8185_24640 [Deltaproteobacteria bacterium]|jgi:hypothetical protein
MRIYRLILLFIVLTSNVGCLSPIAISTMGTVGSDAPVAFHHSGRGKGESFWIAKYDDVITATSRAGEALSLELKEKKIQKDQTFFRFYDSTKERIDLFIDRRSDTMTSLQFDVGWFGSIAFGHLMVRQIIDELIDSGGFLEDWEPLKGN